MIFGEPAVGLLPKTTRSQPVGDWSRVTEIAQLFAEGRCSQAILGFLTTTGRRKYGSPQVVEDEEAAASEHLTALGKEEDQLRRMV